MAVEAGAFEKLSGRVDNIEQRLNGHVPEKCVCHEQSLGAVKDDIAEVKRNIGKIFDKLERPLVSLQQAIISALAGGGVALLFAHFAK